METRVQEEVQRNEWEQCFGPDKPWDPMEYMSIRMTQQEVETCREKCAMLGQAGRGKTGVDCSRQKDLSEELGCQNSPEDLDGKMVDTLNSEKFRKGKAIGSERVLFKGDGYQVNQQEAVKGNIEMGGMEYYVDFPPEDENEGNSQLCKIPTVVESQLLRGMSHTLSLKRGREEEDETELVDYNDNSAKKREKGEGKEGWVGGGKMVIDSKFLLTAEEAGHAMPPAPQ